MHFWSVWRLIIASRHCRLPRKIGRARTAAWGLYALVLPAALCVWIIPGYTTVARSLAIGLMVYGVFWLLGGAAVVATRRGWLRPA